MADESKVTVADLQKLKVAELKQILKDRGLPQTGTKNELIERLTKDQDESDSPVEEIVSVTTSVTVEEPITDVPKPVPAKEPVVPVQAEKEPVKVVGPAVIAKITTDIKPVSISSMSAEERLKLRAGRFGSVGEDSKKKLRAERFGTSAAPVSSGKVSVNSLSANSTDVEKLKKRAERFGTVVSSTLSKVDEQEKLQKRKQRFGDKLSSDTTKTSINLNPSSEIEVKKKRRIERFGLT
ncbi:hypothetical protein CHS0354_042983 [Potamilus streckersoni]|uniref:SAP domain-containing protein n=1 Tax=Potamilus streckersoni TaxID=2493646 RepID=A0AAE0W7D3_9BIVA|nr:hypothetical protein CHS0354_042983 [Potamilus streckersoni]